MPPTGINLGQRLHWPSVPDSPFLSGRRLFVGDVEKAASLQKDIQSTHSHTDHPDFDQVTRTSIDYFLPLRIDLFILLSSLTHLLEQPVTSEECKNTALGLDIVPNRVLRQSPPTNTEALSLLFTSSLQLRYIPNVCPSPNGPQTKTPDVLTIIVLFP